MQRVRYAMKKIVNIPGIKIPFEETHHFKEFAVNFDSTGKPVAVINQALLAQGIFGGKDLSGEFPELGQSALFSITEVHTQADIDWLVATLEEVAR
jgi:glycine dehydrogenase subunit 1